MKKNTMILVGIVVIVLAVAIFMFGGSGNAALSGNTNTINPKGEIQVIKLSVEGSKYIMSPSEVKKGIPVRIEADISKMPGCSKSFVIPSFNIRKTFTSTDNIVEFTPDKAGVFNVMCSMNMYKGTLTVLESNGSKSNYVEQASTSGSGSGSCGMAKGSSGGCGCGG
jgi:plastocyanin domain-containing protein